MTEKTELKQLPQNLKDLLKEIGENSVLFHIYTRIHNSDWQVYKNLEHSGCDLVLINPKVNKIIKVEVKTRQSFYSTAISKNTKNQREFQITRNEYEEMDVLICYWFDYNAFFIVPKNDFDPTKNTLKVRIRKDKEGGYGVNQKYYNNWKSLEKLMV